MKQYRTLFFAGIVIAGVFIFVRATWWQRHRAPLTIHRRWWADWAFNFDWGRFRLSFGVE